MLVGEDQKGEQERRLFSGRVDGRARCEEDGWCPDARARPGPARGSRGYYCARIAQVARLQLGGRRGPDAGPDTCLAVSDGPMWWWPAAGVERRVVLPETDDALRGVSEEMWRGEKCVCVLGAGPPSLSPDPPPVSGRRNGGLAGDDGARLPTGLPRGREGAPPPPPTRDPSLRIAPLRSCRVNIAKLLFPGLR